MIYILGGCLLLLICLFCGGVVLLFGYFAWDARQDRLAEVAATAVSTPDDLHPSSEQAVSTPIPPASSNPTTVILTVTPFSPPVDPTQIAPTTDVAPTATQTPILLNVPPEIVQFPIQAADYEAIKRLFEVVQPAYDYFETVTNLGKEDLGARTIKRAPFQIGDVHSFEADEKIVEATADCYN